MCVCALTTKAFIDCNMHDLLYSLSLYVAVYNHRMIVSYIYRTFTRIIAEKKHPLSFSPTRATTLSAFTNHIHAVSQPTSQPDTHTHIYEFKLYDSSFILRTKTAFGKLIEKKKQIQRFGHMTATLVAQFNPILKTKSELQW